MPPKRQFKDESDDETEETTTSEEETDDEETTSPQKQNAVDTSAGGQFIANNPNDEAFEVEDGDAVEKKTPPQGSLNASAGVNPIAGGVGGVASASAPGGGNTLSNNPNDEVFEVEGEQRNVPTPQAGGAEAAQGRIGGGADASAAAGGAAESKIIKNDKHDEFSDVEDDDEEEEEEAETPPRANAAAQQKAPAQQQQQGGGNLISNDHHDEAIDIDGSSAATTPERGNQQQQQQQQEQQQQHLQAAATNAARGQMRPDDDEDDDEDEDEDEDVETSDDDDDNGRGGAPMMGQMAAQAAAEAEAATNGPKLYNSADYNYLAKKVPAEVFEIFSLIDQFQVSEIELPSKFRPFVPEFIPCVGDIDAFCKVPRPDGVPDGFGLHVIDEPSTYQSNPAVVKMNLEYGSKIAVKNLHVESVQDAATRPGLIDRWVAEIRETHAKKPLPSVNYSKPMPDIEELLQVWPAEFEELLSSDLQFPPPQIDLDIEQYCRVMCTMLDIPIYDNIIESLHVMFTLFLEFRANQHFQHN